MKTVSAHNAQQRVQDALARGELHKPKSCPRCGKVTDKLEFSHSNYSGRLSGRFLCVSCHRKGDKANPKKGGSGSVGTKRA